MKPITSLTELDAAFASKCDFCIKDGEKIDSISRIDVVRMTLVEMLELMTSGNLFVNDENER